MTTFNSEWSSALIDRWRIEIHNKAGSYGLVIVRCSRKCKYGEVEAHVKGISQAMHIKRATLADYKVMVAWDRPVTTVEFWIVLAGAAPPMIGVPMSTEMRLRGIYKKKIIPYDCCF